MGERESGQLAGMICLPAGASDWYAGEAGFISASTTGKRFRLTTCCWLGCGTSMKDAAANASSAPASRSEPGAAKWRGAAAGSFQAFLGAFRDLIPPVNASSAIAGARHRPVHGSGTPSRSFHVVASVPS